MRYRAFVMLGLALVLGLASTFLVREWLAGQAQSGPTTPALALTKIVVARVPLGFGAQISSEHLYLATWPADAVPKGAFTSVDDVSGLPGGRVVLRSIEANEPVLATKVSGEGGRATLSTIIGDGMRALTIRVNDVNGVAGFVLPGDRVDILLTREKRGTDASNDILLQNVRVLGVDQEASDRKDKPVVARAVTLEVDPEQAQKLTLAAEIGSLSLALRNHANAVEAKVRTVTLSDLRPATPAAVKTARPAPSGHPVAIMRGTETSRVNVRRE